jgi:hypothetical protein
MRWLILSLCCIISITCFSQIKPSKAIENSDWEVYQQEIPVSGGVRVGLMFEEEDTEFNPSQFFVNIPKTEITNLCVELSSKDGRYSAKLNYDISDVSEGLQQFYLPTKYRDELSGYASDELVILTSLGNTCTEKPEYYLISGWKDTSKPSSMVIYINSAIETSLVVKSEDGNTEEFPFNKVNSPTIAFNKKSVVPLNALASKATILYIKQRVRKMGRVKFNSYEIPLKFTRSEN